VRRAASCSIAPATQVADDAAPRGAKGQPDGALSPPADDSLGHRAEDAEADEHEPAPDGDARREDILESRPGAMPERDTVRNSTRSAAFYMDASR